MSNQDRQSLPPAIPSSIQTCASYAGAARPCMPVAGRPSSASTVMSRQWSMLGAADCVGRVWMRASLERCWS